MDESTRATFAQVNALFEVHRYEEAARILGQIVASDPTNATALCLLARCQLGLNRPDEALVTAQQAIAVAPESDWAHRLRSIAASALKDHATALAAAQEAVRLAPNSHVTYIVLSEAALNSRMTDEAQRAAERARELNPSDPSAHNALGRVALGRRKSTEAEKHFRAALALSPEFAPALNNLGLALQQQGKRRQAVHYFAEASKLDPTRGDYRRNAVRAAQIGIPVTIIALVTVRVALTNSGSSTPKLVLPPGGVYVYPPSSAATPFDSTTGLATQPTVVTVTHSNGGTSTAALVVLCLAIAIAAVLIGRHLLRRSANDTGDPIASKELIRQLRRENVAFGSGVVRAGWLLTRLVAVVAYMLIGFTVLVGGAQLAVGDAPALGVIVLFAGLAAGTGLTWFVRRDRLQH